MIQTYPGGQVEEAPAEEAPAEEAPPFDPVLVRDFFQFLLVGVEGDAPESSKVTCWSETAALRFNHWRESGMLVSVTDVFPLCDAIPMAKMLKKMSEGQAAWEVLNLDHLVAAAGVADGLLKLGKELWALRSVLKGYKGKTADAEEIELRRLSGNLIQAASKVDNLIPAVLDAASSVQIDEFRRDAMAVAVQTWDVVKTVRQAAVRGAFLPSKPLHVMVKKAYWNLQIIRKATPVKLPEANPFNV